MADFIASNEGRAELWTIIKGGSDTSLTNSYFALSVKDTATLLVTDTLATQGIGEVQNTTVSTGYTRQSQAPPAPTSSNPTSVAFSQMSWTTGANTDWPSFCKSVVLCTVSSYSTSGGLSAKWICAWNLQAGGGARNMAQANTTEQFTPLLLIGYV